MSLLCGPSLACQVSLRSNFLRRLPHSKGAVRCYKKSCSISRFSFDCAAEISIMCDAFAELTHHVAPYAPAATICLTRSVASCLCIAALCSVSSSSLACSPSPLASCRPACRCVVRTRPPTNPWHARVMARPSRALDSQLQRSQPCNLATALPSRTESCSWNSLVRLRASVCSALGAGVARGCADRDARGLC